MMGAKTPYMAGRQVVICQILDLNLTPSRRTNQKEVNPVSRTSAPLIKINSTYMKHKA